MSFSSLLTVAGLDKLRTSLASTLSQMRMIIHDYHSELCEAHTEITQVKHGEKHIWQNSKVMKNISVPIPGIQC